MLLELERLYNHVADIGALCNDAGYAILNSHASRIREQLLRINDTVTGHRLLRGAIHPGGAVIRAAPEPGELAAIAAGITEIAALALDHSVVRDRFAGTAVLTAEQAAGLGTLGYVARASGLDTDARRDHPLPGVRFPPVTYTQATGDVLARFQARVEETGPAVAFITEAVRRLDGHLGTAPARPIQEPGAPRSGTGIAEGWRGTIVHRAELAPDGTLTRVKIADPSFFNWPALPVALTGAIVPDFPLANKSFGLSYPGNDL
jgi:Ni,Fe-hydrogenase III large subunit